MNVDKTVFQKNVDKTGSPTPLYYENSQKENYRIAHSRTVSQLKQNALFIKVYEP